MKDKDAKQESIHKSTGMLLLSIAVLLVVAAVTLLLPAGGKAPAAEAPEEHAASAGDRPVVAENAELYQTLTYTRCEHVVTRRVTAPVELYGKTLEEVQPLYEEWKITEFSPTEIRMEQQPDLFCPDHLVLMANEAGTLCVFQNKYGDAMALVKELETQLSALPAAAQEEVSAGVGFATLGELEQWLESVES